MSKTWSDWIEHHGRLFAMVRPEELPILKEWSILLGLRGWSAQEAIAASEHLIFNAPPVARAQHLAGLEAALLTLRKKQKDELPADDARGICVDCRGTGFVSVPSLLPDPLNCNGWYTYLVTCHCGLGHYKLTHWHIDERVPAKKTILSLAEYEAANPDWKQQLAERDEYLRRLPKEKAFAKDLDMALGLIQARARAGSNSQNRSIANGR